MTPCMGEPTTQDKTPCKREELHLSLSLSLSLFLSPSLAELHCYCAWRPLCPLQNQPAIHETAISLSLSLPILVCKPFGRQQTGSTQRMAA